MVWNDLKDELLCREILLMEPYKFKSRSRERGNIWKEISEHLNSASVDDMFFRVDHRAVRDRFNLLIAHHDQKIKDQQKASGINPIETELDIEIETIMDRMKVCEEEFSQLDKENTDKDAKEKEKAEDMRKKALESFQETRERKKLDDSDSESCQPSKRRRSSGSDTIQFLREKTDSDREMRMQELELRRNEQNILKEQQTNMFNAMIQQNQQMMALMTQLLQQNK